MNTHLLTKIAKTSKRLVQRTVGVAAILVVGFYIASPAVFAAPYGEGQYGEGIYNQGQTQTSAPNPGSSTPSAPSCTAQAPGNNAPWLYAATAKSGNAIELKFTEAQEPFDHYVVEYGFESGKYLFGATNAGGKGATSAVIQALSPNTTYFFRVRAGNGCATGPWSNEISAKTWPLFVTRNLDVTVTEMTPSTETGPDRVDRPSEEEAEEPTAEQRYLVRVQVVDTDQQPVLGASVTLFSKPRTTQTDEDGLAVFEDVEEGEHTLVVEHDGYKGEQKLLLTGDTTTFDITIEIKPQDFTITPLAGGIIALLGGGVVVLLLRMRSLKMRG